MAGGASIKSLQEGLQIRAETRGNPWVIIGPKHDVREFLLRVRLRFGVSTALAGQDPWRFACPGCGLDFPSWELMLAHVRRPPAVCPARSCIACDCGAVYADGPSCRKHEALCKKVQRCPGCSKAFASQAEVADHVKSEGFLPTFIAEELLLHQLYIYIISVFFIWDSLSSGF